MITLIYSFHLEMPKVKVETQFSPCVSPHIFEAAGLKRLSVGMGLHKPTAPPHR